MITRTIDATGDIRYHNEQGQLHRTDGPAIERTNGVRGWYLNGELHRTDGPAAEWTDGTLGWFLNGRRYSFCEWIRKIEVSTEQRDELITLYKRIDDEYWRKFFSEEHYSD